MTTLEKLRRDYEKSLAEYKKAKAQWDATYATLTPEQKAEADAFSKNPFGYYAR